MSVIDMSQRLDGRLGDAKIEEAIQAKGLTAPRVTPEQIAERVKHDLGYLARTAPYYSAIIDYVTSSEIR